MIWAIKITTRGIQCDHCAWQEPEAKIVKAWVNCPCPVCGANLCTHEDWRALRQMIWLARVANVILFPFTFTWWVLNGGITRIVHIRVRMNGTGKPSLGPVEEVDE
jgi:hypothetical protein